MKEVNEGVVVVVAKREGMVNKGVVLVVAKREGMLAESVDTAVERVGTVGDGASTVVRIEGILGKRLGMVFEKVGI